MSLEVRDLQFGYKNFRLSVPYARFKPREVTCIVGRNGAGKTTFLKCLASVLPAPKCSLFIDGLDLTELRVRKRARLISYAPQEQALSLNYSVLDFVLMGRAAFVPLFSVPTGKDVRQVREAISFVGLDGFQDRKFSELSGGERRLVLIARTLAQSADILLLDEPTTFLDPKHEAEVMDLCRRMAYEKGKTVIATLHNLEMAVSYADSMVFMKNGEILASGRPDDILSEALLEKAYDIPMMIVSYNGKKLIVR